MKHEQSYTMKFSPRKNFHIDEFLKKDLEKKQQYLESSKKEGHYHDMINKFFDQFGYELVYNQEYIEELQKTLPVKFYSSNIDMKLNSIRAYSKSFRLIIELDERRFGYIGTASIRCKYGEYKDVRRFLIIELMKLVSANNIENNSERTLSKKEIWDWSTKTI